MVDAKLTDREIKGMVYSHTGSNPVLTTEGVNPETRKEKVDDSLERQAKRSGGGIGRR